MNIHDVLNKRYALKNLSDTEFEANVENLAEQLESVSFKTQYKTDDLLFDWNNLWNWQPTGNSINSTSRLGMKLCEYYFPNFYDIKNKHGQSFTSMWSKENLIKVLKWNRKCHSTPYMSELRRGVYFCGGLTKSTMFRPQLAKMICHRYNPKIVLDPCAGWGGRLLGVVSTGAHYIAFEPNTETYKNLGALVQFLDIAHRVVLINDDARNMPQYNLGKVDLVLTSPPYYDVEVYCEESTQSIKNCETYDQWVENFLDPVISMSVQHLSEKGASCWNVAKVGKYDMWKSVADSHAKLNFHMNSKFDVISSKRQALQSSTKNSKSMDTTIAYTA